MVMIVFMMTRKIRNKKRKDIDNHDDADDEKDSDS